MTGTSSDHVASGLTETAHPTMVVVEYIELHDAASLDPVETRHGFRAVCACAWSGPWRATRSLAAVDANEHARGAV